MVKLRWVPSDEAELRAIETQILANAVPEGRCFVHDVPVPACGHVHTISSMPVALDDVQLRGHVEATAGGSSGTGGASADRRPHVVMLHGFGMGAVQWVENFVALADRYHVHAIDLPGFGSSGRPAVRGTLKDEHDAIAFFTDSLRQWLDAMEPVFAATADNAGRGVHPPQAPDSGAPSFTPVILVGHSFGGYISGKFAARHSHRLRSLILVDAFGVANRDQAHFDKFNANASWFTRMKVSLVSSAFYGMNPFALIRGAGPLGPKLVASRAAPKFRYHFSRNEALGDLMAQYVYHNMAQTPSGESAFALMIEGIGLRIGPGWRVRAPMQAELEALPPALHVTFLHGQRSWIPARGCLEIAAARAKAVPAGTQQPTSLDKALATARVAPDAACANTAVYILPDAGHHVYIESADFNTVMIANAVPAGHRPVRVPVSGGRRLAI